ncbi:MAG: hypothetical protein DA329_01830 [Candidatus Nitrosocosmicus sp.]|nr:hypothetical protein [Candidatus Nitrosocosmicus sp.]
MMHIGISRKLVALLFSFFLLVNIASSGGHFDWWDGMETFFVTESMVLKHTAKLDPLVPSIAELNFDINYTINTNKILQNENSSNNGIDTIIEPVYTVRSLILSAIAVPFYYAALLFSVSPIALIGLFLNSMIISAICVVIFCFSIDLYRSKKLAFALSLVFGVCSFIWPYNTTFWVQPLQALTLILAAYYIHKSLHSNSSFICHFFSMPPNKKAGIYFALLGGIFSGLSIFAHPTSIIFLPGFILYFFITTTRRHNKNTKTFVYFLMALAIMVFLAGLVNYLRFDSFTEFGYGSFSSLEMHDGWRGLIGLLISPGAGMLVFFPLAILLPWGFKYLKNQNKGLVILFAYIIILNWIYVGTLSFDFEPFSWSGGVAWGPRYLIPILPFVTLVIGSAFMRLGQKLNLKVIVLVSLCISGFVVNLLGKLVWYQYGIMYGWERESLSTLPNSLDIMTWNPYYSPIILHVKSLFEGYVSTIQPEMYAGTTWNWVAYGLAPCSIDGYIYCTFGSIFIAIVLLITTFIAIVLMKEIGLLKRPFNISLLKNQHNGR